MCEWKGRWVGVCVGGSGGRLGAQSDGLNRKFLNRIFLRGKLTLHGEILHNKTLHGGILYKKYLHRRDQRRETIYRETFE